MVVYQSVRLAGIGSAPGSPIAATIARSIQRLFVGVEPMVALRADRVRRPRYPEP